MKLNHAEYEVLTRDTVRWAIRRKGIKQKEGLLRAVRTATHSGSKTRFNPTLPSAAWHYENGSHCFQIGDFVPGLLTTADEGKACRALLAHECGHALLTERNARGLASEVHKRGIPFSMLNLFEDARIEAKLRREAAFVDSFPSRRFGWVNFYEQPAETDNALRYFWALVNGESESFSDLSIRAPKWTGDEKTKLGAPTVKTVRRIFTAACAAPTTGNLIPLLVEWQQHFGVDNRSPGARVDGRIGGHSDGSGGSKPAGDYATETVTGKAGHGASETGGGVAPEGVKDEPLPGFTPPTESGSPSKFGYINSFQNRAVHDHPERYAPGIAEQTREQINRLANIVRRAATAPVQTSTSGSRIHLNNAITGQDNAFVRSAKDAGKRKIVVVFDCSGSMALMHQDHGRAFLLSLVALHRAGKISADIWLTGGGTCCRINVNAATARDLIAISPHCGTESFAGTLATIPLDELRKADAVVCYTDGQIGDGKVDAATYRNKGVNLLGCAVTPGCTHPDPTSSERCNTKAIRDALNFHFGRGITTETGTQLANALVAYFTQR